MENKNERFFTSWEQSRELMSQNTESPAKKLLVFAQSSAAVNLFGKHTTLLTDSTERLKKQGEGKGI